MSFPNLILYSKYSYLASCCLLLDLWYFAFLGLVEATRPPFLAGDHHQDLGSSGCPVYCLAARVWSVKMTTVILTDQTLGAKQKSRQSVGQLSCFPWPSQGMCWQTVTWSEQWSEDCDDCKWQPNQKLRVSFRVSQPPGRSDALLLFLELRAVFCVALWRKVPVTVKVFSCFLR